MPDQHAHDTKTILVVEDDRTNALVFEAIITEETPYRVWLMRSGKEVLQQIDALKQVNPALCIVDYLLPELTGLELYDQLSQDDVFATIPVLMTSASASPLLEEKLAARGLPLLHKPFELDTLVHTINQLLPPPCV